MGKKRKRTEVGERKKHGGKHAGRADAPENRIDGGGKAEKLFNVHVFHNPKVQKTVALALAGCGREDEAVAIRQGWGIEMVGLPWPEAEEIRRAVEAAGGGVLVEETAEDELSWEDEDVFDEEAPDGDSDDGAEIDDVSDAGDETDAEAKVSVEDEGEGAFRVVMTSEGQDPEAVAEAMAEATGMDGEEALEMVLSGGFELDNLSLAEAGRIQDALEAAGADAYVDEGNGDRDSESWEGKTPDGRRISIWHARQGRLAPGESAGDEIRLWVPGGQLMLEFVWCPPGSFTMGSPSGEEGRGDDERQRRVTLSRGFWMGKTPVTVQQWKQVMPRLPWPYHEKREDTAWLAAFRGGQYPVVGVSWDEAQAFCREAASQCGLRLPTEAEWEYACRAGSTGAYGGTGRADEMGWHAANSLGHAHPVGQKAPNAWGLYDMHGNVWEWCTDRYGERPGVAAIDPAGPRTGEFYVRRGGSWGSRAGDCRSAYRGADERSDGDCYGGLRVCCWAGDEEEGEE